MPRVSEAYRERKRQQILDAALACFERRGLHLTTTDDIAAEVGMSVGAMYRYFAGKYAIVEAIAEQRHAHERRLLAEALTEPDPRRAVRRFVTSYFDWLAEPGEQRRRRVTVHVWAQALHEEPLRAIVLAGMAPATEVAEASGMPSVPFLPSGTGPAADPGSFLRVIAAIIQGFVLQQAWDPGVDLDAYRATVLALLDAALSPRDLPEPAD